MKFYKLAGLCSCLSYLFISISQAYGATVSRTNFQWEELSGELLLNEELINQETNQQADILLFQELTLLLDQELLLALTITSQLDSIKTESKLAVETQNLDPEILAADLTQEIGIIDNEVNVWQEVFQSLRQLQFQGINADSLTDSGVTVVNRSNLDEAYVGIYGFTGRPVRRGLNYGYGYNFYLINPALGGYGQRIYDPATGRLIDAQGMAYGSLGNSQSVDNFGNLDFSVNLAQIPETELPTSLYTAYRDDIQKMYQLEPFGQLEISVDLPTMPKETLPMMTKVR